MKSLSDLEKKLDDIQRKAINEFVKAQRDTAESIKKDAREFAPKRKGTYASTIEVGETTIKENSLETPVSSNLVVINSKGKIYNLGYLLEHGTSPHLIEPVFAKVLHFKIDGQDIFAKRVHHPGFIARPHYSIALNLNRERYKENVKEAVRRLFNE